jgi:hypothetical protein
VSNLCGVVVANTLIQPDWPPSRSCYRRRRPVMELPPRKEPNEDSQRRAARRKYNVQLEQSNLDTFLQQRGIDVPRLKRSRLEPIPDPGSAANGTCTTFSRSMGLGPDHGARPNESTSQVRTILSLWDTLDLLTT